MRKMKNEKTVSKIRKKRLTKSPWRLLRLAKRKEHIPSRIDARVALPIRSEGHGRANKLNRSVQSVTP